MKYTRIFALLSIQLMLFVPLSNAQEGSGQAPLSKGQKQLNFGINGFGGSLPLYIGVDFAVHDDITVGPAAALNLFNNNGYLRLGAKADYHWNRLIGIPSNWDFYTGLNAGWRFDPFNQITPGLDLGGQVGGRYYWSSRWAFNLEFGFSNSVGGGIGLSYIL